LTDNRNCTAADLRTAFNKYGGLGETGCVSWISARKGVVTIIRPVEEETLLGEVLLDSGAEFYELIEAETKVEIFTDIVNLENLSRILQSKGYAVINVDFR
jgi:transcriptional/translational regulatory protein YebC/TACO1